MEGLKHNLAHLIKRYEQADKRETEADVRANYVDWLFFYLGWDVWEKDPSRGTRYQREGYIRGAGYVDVGLEIGGEPVLMLEAKRFGAIRLAVCGFCAKSPEENVGMERWEEETYQYHERLASLRGWRPDLSHLIERLPDIPLDYTPSMQGVVGINLSLYVLGCMTFADQATVAFLKLWGDGLFATISLPARLIYELWGATHFAWQTLVQMQGSGDVPRALARTQRLTLGARSEVQLPWGGTTSEKAVHVMDLIRLLADVHPRADHDYTFLCESCHPSYLRLTSWSLSGPTWELGKREVSAAGA